MLGWPGVGPAVTSGAPAPRGRIAAGESRHERDGDERPPHGSTVALRTREALCAAATSLQPPDDQAPEEFDDGVSKGSDEQFVEQVHAPRPVGNRFGLTELRP